MDVTPQRSTDQSKFWNGLAGHAWLDLQVTLDQLFSPFEDLLAASTLAAPGARVLDIGCGTGSTTLAIARQRNAEGRCLGVDISEPMVTAAQARAEREGLPARFIRADAQTHAFEPASFDLLVSRFGVMFFDDPVAAFSNLRRAARDGAELRVIAWRSPAENPFMTTAERAAAPLLDLPARKPGTPGQFAFADRARVTSILEQGGWSDIDIRPIDVACTMSERDLINYLSRLGPLGQLLPGTNEPLRSQVIDTVRAAFEPFVHGDEVRLTAACWTIGAR